MGSFILSIMMNTQWICIEVVRVVGSLLEKAAWVLLFSLLPSGRCYGQTPLGAGFGLKACALLRWHQSVRGSRVWSDHRARPSI